MTDPQQPTKDKPCAALEALRLKFPYHPEGTELDPGGHVAWLALKAAGPFDRRADVVPREVYEKHIKEAYDEAWDAASCHSYYAVSKRAYEDDWQNSDAKARLDEG